MFPLQDHLDLLRIPWQSVRTRHDTYYVKSRFGSGDYSLLVTNLKHVWGDSAPPSTLDEKAKRHRLLLETTEQKKTLLEALEAFVQDWDQCEFVIAPDDVKPKGGRDPL